MILVLSTLPDIMLYVCTNICQSISSGFRVTDLNSGFDARVVANVDGWTDVLTDVWMDIRT